MVSEEKGKLTSFILRGTGTLKPGKSTSFEMSYEILCGSSGIVPSFETEKEITFSFYMYSLGGALDRSLPTKH